MSETKIEAYPSRLNNLLPLVDLGNCVPAGGGVVMRPLPERLQFAKAISLCEQGMLPSGITPLINTQSN
jgi:hypothetical protein